LRKLRREHPIDAFDCGQEDLNQWLRKHALQNQGAGAAQTYVGLVGEVVIGYYSLAVGQMSTATRRSACGIGLARHPVADHASLARPWPSTKTGRRKA